MKQDYEIKFQQFLNEEKHFSFAYDDLKNLLMDHGGDEDVIEAYINSVKMDMKTNADDYATFTKEDFIEDFDNYVSDKMSS